MTLGHLAVAGGSLRREEGSAILQKNVVSDQEQVPRRRMKTFYARPPVLLQLQRMSMIAICSWSSWCLCRYEVCSVPPTPTSLGIRSRGGSRFDAQLLAVAIKMSCPPSQKLNVYSPKTSYLQILASNTLQQVKRSHVYYAQNTNPILQ